MNINIKGKSAENFVIELNEKISQTGYNILSKNDLYDFLLYLFNKHNDRKFLDEDSNYENLIALKITEARLKTAKLNIALKYKTDEERRKSFILFLKKLAQNKITIIEKDDIFIFCIDDPAARLELENCLKEKLGVTLEYGENRERVKIEKYALLRIFKEYSKCSETEFADVLRKELEKRELIKKGKKAAGKLKDFVMEFAKNVTKDVLIVLAKSCF